MSKKLKPFERIPKEKQELIFQLAKEKRFVHPQKRWQRSLTISPRNRGYLHGRTSKKIPRVIKILVADPHAGKPFYTKIAEIVGSDVHVVMAYLKRSHPDMMKKYRLKLKKRDEEFNLLSEKEKLKVMEEFCKNFDGNTGWRNQNRRKPNTCKLCSTILPIKKSKKHDPKLCPHHNMSLLMQKNKNSSHHKNLIGDA